MLKFLSTCKLW